MLNNKPTIRFLEPKAVTNSQKFKNDLHVNSSKKRLSARDIITKPSSKSSKVSPEHTIFSRNPSEGNIPIENLQKKKNGTRSLTKLPSNKKKVFTPIISPNFQPKISHRRIHSDFLSNVYKSKITSEIKTLEKEISDKKITKKKIFSLHARNNSDPFNTQSPYLSQEDTEKLALIKYIAQHFLQFNECPVTTIEFYRPIGLIGKGAFGKVLHCEHKLTGKKVAIKAISKAQLQNQRSQKKVFQEVYILRKIKSKFVIKILEVFESDKNFLMVLEYAGGGDLLHYVREKGKLKEEEAKKIFKQIVQGAISIHEAGILHRDFKLDNILLDSRYSIIKICDFGVSKIIKEGEIITDQCGTPAYLAPEIIKNQGYQGFYVDV